MLGFLVIFSSCSKEEETSNNNNTPAAKVLNKATLTPKKWYSQGSSIIHDFKAGGAYATSGTWKWIGTSNSDTMEIVTQSGFSPVKWKFFWNTDHEMRAMRTDQGVQLDFRDSAW
ncbi:MAG: hypothetical protein JNM67_05190 [Bacteroidetes bacterium]|nr:hypothetical protein [Bacteroidota bacterium]